MMSRIWNTYSFVVVYIPPQDSPQFWLIGFLNLHTIHSSWYTILWVSPPRIPHRTKTPPVVANHPLLPPQSLVITDLFSVLTVSSFPECHLDGILQYTVFWVWHISFSKIHLTPSSIPLYGSNSVSHPVRAPITKVAQTRWLITIGHLILTIFEARSPRSGWGPSVTGFWGGSSSGLCTAVFLVYLHIVAEEGRRALRNHFSYILLLVSLMCWLDQAKGCPGNW